MSLALLNKTANTQFEDLNGQPGPSPNRDMSQRPPPTQLYRTYCHGCLQLGTVALHIVYTFVNIQQYKEINTLLQVYCGTHIIPSGE